MKMKLRFRKPHNLHSVKQHVAHDQKATQPPPNPFAKATNFVLSNPVRVVSLVLVSFTIIFIFLILFN